MMFESETAATQTAYTLVRADFPVLFDVLHAHGYQIIGPTVHDDVIAFTEIDAVDELPIGWSEIQEAGVYRLVRRDDEALFGYTVGPQHWKRYLLPPQLCLWQAVRDQGQLEFTPVVHTIPKLALVGLRACDLAAIAVQDRVFLHMPYADADYAARRRETLIIAVNCTQAAATCFCASIGSGPSVTTGYDLALTEILDADTHRFIMTVGSPRGQEIVDELPVTVATPAEIAAAAAVVAATANQMGRTLATAGLPRLLYRNLEHPHWDEIATRCLTCGNCTLVCPTCFCTTVEDSIDLRGRIAQRQRVQDSCFSVEFSHVHGGSVRTSAKARFRQWMVHKLASWIDQFGVMGCVGCGRCITWCPVGIDITAEANTFRMLDQGRVQVTPAREGQGHHESS